MPFLKLSGSVLHIVVMVLIRSNGKQIDFNQQKRGELTHYTLKISFCIPAMERFRKIIQGQSLIYSILTTHFFVTELALWLEYSRRNIVKSVLLQTCIIASSNRFNRKIEICISRLTQISILRLAL